MNFAQAVAKLFLLASSKQQAAVCLRQRTNRFCIGVATELEPPPSTAPIPACSNSTAHVLSELGREGDSLRPFHAKKSNRVCPYFLIICIPPRPPFTPKLFERTFCRGQPCQFVSIDQVGFIKLSQPSDSHIYFESY